MLIFSFRLGRTQLKTDRVHAEDPVEKTLAVPKSAKSNGWTCSSQLWHPPRLGCYCLSNSRRLRRGVVTAHTLVEVQQQRWTVVIYSSVTSQTSEQEYSDLTASNTCAHRHRTSASLSKAFHEETSRMLSRSRQNVCRRFWYTPKICQKFLESENLVCSATAGTKTSLGRPATSLGHQGWRRVVWEGPKYFKLCQIIFNYAQYIFQEVTAPPWLRAWHWISFSFVSWHLLQGIWQRKYQLYKNFQKASQAAQNTLAGHMYKRPPASAPLRLSA